NTKPKPSGRRREISFLPKKMADWTKSVDLKIAAANSAFEAQIRNRLLPNEFPVRSRSSRQESIQASCNKKESDEIQTYTRPIVRLDGSRLVLVRRPLPGRT